MLFKFLRINLLLGEDATDLLYPGKEGKYNAIIKEIENRHATGQPVLVGTIAIETSELLSKMLTKKKIPHEVLNAKNHAREAEIIAHAGEKRCCYYCYQHGWSWYRY